MNCWRSSEEHLTLLILSTPVLHELQEPTQLGGHLRLPPPLWFFYLRAEDIPRLKSEWFRDTGEEIICDLEITKGDRDKHPTTHYRPDAIKNWRRLAARKPKGHLACPPSTGWQ